MPLLDSLPFMYKVDDFIDFVFAFSYTRFRLKRSLILKEEFVPQGPLFRRDVKSFMTKISPLKVYPFPLKFQKFHS